MKKTADTIGTLVVIALLLYAFIGLSDGCGSFRRVGTPSHLSLTRNHLLQLALGLEGYAEKHGGRLPAHAIYSADGRPLLSWRVAVLPFLEQKELYRQFRLDEPWDGPNNVRLLDRMPAVFAAARHLGKERPSVTPFQVFVGPGAAFEGRVGLRRPEDFPAGPRNTLLLAEATPVPWTKPADIEFTPDGPQPELGDCHAEVVCAVDASGAARYLPRPVPAGLLRAAVSRAGGEAMPPDW